MRKWATRRGRKGGKDEPDISSITICVACNFSIKVAFKPSSVTPDSSAMMGGPWSLLFSRPRKWRVEVS